MDVTAIVPLKALDRAKGRLAGCLDAASRRQLVAWMFARVVEACRASRHVRDVVVVAGDGAAAALASLHGVERVVVEAPSGLAAALAAADRATADAHASLVVAADLPLVTAAELDTVCRVGAAGPCVVVAAADDGGTGALLRRPAGVIGTAFGQQSAAAHLHLAQQARVRGVRLRLPGLALDVDTPVQLRAAGVLGGRETAEWSSPLLSSWSLKRCAGGTSIQEHGMAQGTVKHFDIETSTGTILLDNQDELPIDAEAFAATGLNELRLGQRVRFDVEEEGSAKRVRRLNIVSL